MCFSLDFELTHTLCVRQVAEPAVYCTPSTKLAPPSQALGPGYPWLVEHLAAPYLQVDLTVAAAKFTELATQLWMCKQERPGGLQDLNTQLSFAPTACGSRLEPGR